MPHFARSVTSQAVKQTLPEWYTEIQNFLFNWHRTENFNDRASEFSDLSLQNVLMKGNALENES